ncbi:tRNA-dihydrouridine synthase [uncultured Clostridium sp.]|uniref:tRNA dihydrouridine synthase n=1 Tax=uncultured Clostridium sp. TaxID=59620 RepID=UPI0025F37E09|nr:tRNA-dihydrouridine synthase family protein [uncultured Clostridium sp.]
MKYYFAPMEGITGYIYRSAHHRIFGGVDRYFTPFIATTQNHRLSSREKNDICPEHNREMSLVPQILTNKAEDFIWASREIAGYGYREVNLNLGCPSGTVVAKKKGSGFLFYTVELDRFLEQVVKELEPDGISVSVKTRIGLNSPDEFEDLMQVYNRYPLKELIIHPRVRSDFYANKPNLSVFGEGAKQSSNPVCYNGDIFTREAFTAFTEQFPPNQFPMIESVMLGRGAVSNPALFQQLKAAENTASGTAPGTDSVRENPDKPSKSALKAFHDEIFNGYRETMSGDRNTLFKMKELWFYMGGLFDGKEEGIKEKQLKKIKKSQKFPEYLAAVEEIFAECCF